MKNSTRCTIFAGALFSIVLSPFVTIAQERTSSSVDQLKAAAAADPKISAVLDRTTPTLEDQSWKKVRFKSSNNDISLHSTAPFEALSPEDKAANPKIASVLEKTTPSFEDDSWNIFKSDDKEFRREQKRYEKQKRRAMRENRRRNRNSCGYSSSCGSRSRVRSSNSSCSTKSSGCSQKRVYTYTIKRSCGK